MKTILYFKMAEVARLVDHAENSTERRGHVGEFHYANYSHISEVPPGLLWGKGDGIYLLTNGKMEEYQTYEGEGLISYAVGYDPNRNGSVHSRAAQAVGGDDFVEFIEMGKVRRVVGDNKGGYLAMEVTETHFSVFWVPRVG